jgi:hypothetical protein
MPHLPVITDMFRVTFLWNRLNGVQPRNVIYIQCASGNVADIPGALNAAWHSGMWDPIPSGYGFSLVSTLPLDGSSASVVQAVTTQTGTATGSDIIPGSAGIVSFATGFRGPANRGRIFLGPQSEGEQTNGLAQDMAACATAWAAFQTSLQAHTPVCAHHVVSIKNSTHHPVTSYVGRPVCGSQLRRLKQLR